MTVRTRNRDIVLNSHDRNLDKSVCRYLSLSNRFLHNSNYAVKSHHPLQLLTAAVARRLKTPEPRLFIITRHYHRAEAIRITEAGQHNNFVIMTDSILRRLSAREIAAVIAHEVAHFALYDRPDNAHHTRPCWLTNVNSGHWREYAADAAAAHLFGAAAFESALRQLHVKAPSTRFDTRSPCHPTLAARITALRRRRYAGIWKHVQPVARLDTPRAPG